MSGAYKNHHHSDCACFSIKEFKRCRCHSHHISDDWGHHHECDDCHHCGKCNRCHHHHKCGRYHHGGCFSSRYDCHDNLFEITLAGLMDNLNFKLFKRRKCPLEVTTEGGCHFKGKTCNVGIDYIDIKDSDGKVVTVLKDKISHIKWG